MTLTKQFQCNLKSLPCEQHSKQQHGCSCSNGICTPEGCDRTQAAPVAQTRFTTSTPKPFNARKHRVSCDSYLPSITLTKQFHCDLQAPPCKSQPPAIRDAGMRLPAAIAALLHISTLFTSPLFSHPYSIHISIHVTSLLYSYLYTCHISTLFTSLLSSHPFTSLLSSHPFTSLLSSYFHSHSPHIPTPFTSLLSSHPCSLHIPILFFITSLRSSFFLFTKFFRITEFRHLNFL